MKRKIVWLVVSCLIVLALLVTSCAQAEEKAPAPAAKETAPVVKEAAPVVKEAAPAVKEAAPAAAEKMVKITLKKLDGTKMEKLVEKPQYGGTIICSQRTPILGWDEVYQPPWGVARSNDLVNEELMTGDFTRGKAGTGETSWVLPGWFDLPYMTMELAESWEMPDDQTLVYHIRKGVKWALDPANEASRLVNGRELTADDVAFSLKRILIDNPTATTYTTIPPEGRPTAIYATDKYTVVIKVPKGMVGAVMDGASDLTRIYAPEVAKKYGDYRDWRNAVGTGPFIVKDYVSMSSLTFARNPNYWRKDPLLPEYQLPYVDEYRLLIIPDPSTEFAALRTGKIDWAGNYFPEEAEPLLKTNPELKSLQTISWMTQVVTMRVDKPELPWYDIRVRRALAMGIDRQEIIDTIYKGQASTLVYMVPPIPEWEGAYTPLEKLPASTRELYEYHPDKAKQLLAEAGYPNGFKAEVILTVAEVDILSVVKAYWAKIGVDLELQVKDAGVRQAIYVGRTQKQMMITGCTVNNPYQMWLTYSANMFNMSIVNDPWIDQKTVELYALYFDRPKRRALLKEVNLYTLDKAWYTFLPVPYKTQLWQPWLKNYYGEYDIGYYNYYGWPMYAWVDQELKKSMGH